MPSITTIHNNHHNIMKTYTKIIVVAVVATIAGWHVRAQDQSATPPSIAGSGTTIAVTTDSAEANMPATDALPVTPVFSSTEANYYAMRIATLCKQMIAAHKSKDYAKAATLRAQVQEMSGRDSAVSKRLDAGDAAKFKKWKSSLMSTADSATSLSGE